MNVKESTHNYYYEIHSEDQKKSGNGKKGNGINTVRLLASSSHALGGVNECGVYDLGHEQKFTIL